MIALDTNVLIYACDKADPARQEIALDVIASTTDAVILWQVACEFVAASRKLERQGFTAADAWARLNDFLGVCPLVVPTGRAVLDQAKSHHLLHNVSFWDAMILAACVDAGVSLLYSEDVPGEEIGGIPVVNPFK
ncbi:MAG: PIN domain-containing protein [Vicinamibacterales bacterium]